MTLHGVVDLDLTTRRSLPAVLGGPSTFPDGVPFARPHLAPLEDVVARLRPSYEAGVITNGPLVHELELACAERLGVDHAVAVSSCTVGLLLTFQALGPRPSALLPSFTFSASAHALRWSGVEPVFIECDPESFQVDLADARRRLHHDSFIVAVHMFGAPAPVEGLAELALEGGVPLIFDSAHAFGARRAGRPVGGFGDAEVFSLSPTKLVTAGEGGIVATNSLEVAEHIRLGRNYGDAGDYDTRFVGINGRMSELHAAVALESLRLLDDQIERRHRVADTYRSMLQDVPGIALQHIDPGDTTTYKDFVVAVDPVAFGCTRDQLRTALWAEGVDCRPYFHPPVHRQQAYQDRPRPLLPVTNRVSGRTLALPMFASLDVGTAAAVAKTIRFLHQHAEALR